jgi:gliding motility-associated-like protein
MYKAIFNKLIRKQVYMLVLCIAPTYTMLLGQNLVKNGSFEEDNYWKNFSDTAQEFYTYNHCARGTDLNHWNFDLTVSLMIQNYKHYSFLTRVNASKDLFPYLINENFLNKNTRDNKYFKPNSNRRPNSTTLLKERNGSINSNRARMPHYPDSALHGHNYLNLRTASMYTSLQDTCFVDFTWNHNDTFHCVTRQFQNIYPLYPNFRMQSNEDYNDIIDTELKEPLQKGKRYKIGFFAATCNNYVDSATLLQLQSNPTRVKTSYDIEQADDYFKNRTGEHKSYASDGLGVILTKDKVFGNIHPQPPYTKVFENNSAQFRIEKPFMNKGGWDEFSWVFTAEEEYTRLYLGNFWALYEQNMIRWPFLIHGVSCCGPSGMQSYFHFDMSVYIDSVYLIPLGPRLPQDIKTCIGETIKIQDLGNKEVTWILENGTRIDSTELTLNINQTQTRIIAYKEGEYDTMYVYAKAKANYELLHTDTMCMAEKKEFNRYIIQSAEPKLKIQWQTATDTQENKSYTSTQAESIQVSIVDSFMCADTLYVESKENCICPVLIKDTTVCAYSTVTLKEKTGCKVDWFNGTELIQGQSDSLVLQLRDESILVEVRGEEKTSYIQINLFSAINYNLRYTDTMCSYFENKPINRIKIDVNSTIQATWEIQDQRGDAKEIETDKIGLLKIELSDNNGCSIRDSIELQMDCPCVLLPQDTMICVNEKIRIEDYYQREIEWYINGENVGKAKYYEFVPSESKTEVRGVCDTSIQTMQVWVKPQPQYNIIHSDSMCYITGRLYNKLEVQSSENIKTRWRIDNREYEGTPYIGTDTGWMELRVQDSIGCEYLDSLQIGEYCPEFSEICAFPNALSPNGDGINDMLSISCSNIKQAQTRIYNRWGDLIKESNELFNIWDGSYQGEKVPDGVYLLTIEYELYTAPGIKKMYRGTLTLVR